MKKWLQAKLFKNKIDVNLGKIYSVKDDSIEIMNSINNNGYCTGMIEDCYGNIYHGAHEVIYAEAYQLPKHLWGNNEINHIDENRTNNAISNLELKDKSYNNTYNDRHIKVGKQLHNRKDMSKTVYKYSLDGKLVETYPSASEAARQNNVNTSRIVNCCNGGYYCKTTNKWMNKTVKGYRYSYEHP